MKTTKAIAASLGKLSVTTADVLDDTVSATKRNWMFIRNGLQALLATTIFWIRFLIYLICLPGLFVYAFYHQLKKRGAND